MTHATVMPQASPGEDAGGAALRPLTLADFTGQTALKDRLEVAIFGAASRGEAIDHMLFSGPPGLGKTTLANIVANEMGRGFVQTSGPAIEKLGDLLVTLTRLGPGDVLFIDEIHRMPRAVEEYLYSAMEDFRVDVVLDRGTPQAQVVPIQLQHFTLVGATTLAGMLSKPLRDRFGLQFTLAFYSVPELGAIAWRSARKLGLALGQDEATEIAMRSRGTPRIANRLVRRVRDYATMAGVDVVTAAMVREWCGREGVDGHGLDELDRLYLATLARQGGSAGVAALAATMQQQVSTLEETVEPYLLHEGFVVRAPGGRRITTKGRETLR